MNVWVLLQTSGYGGTEVHTLQLLSALQRAGHCTTLVCLGHRALDQQASDTGATVHRVEGDIASARRGDWQALAALFERHRQQCHALVIQKGSLSLGSPAFLRMCRHYFPRLYLIEHSKPEPIRARPVTIRYKFLPVPSLWWLRERQRRRAMVSLADKVIAVSDAVRRALVEHHHYPAQRVMVVRNGVYSEQFEPIAQQKLVHVEPLAAGASRPIVFGMVTRLSAVKGVDLALRAFASFRSQRSAVDAKLIVFGQGEDLRSLVALADELGLSDRVDFAGFTASPTEAFKVIDVIVFASRSEGLALALLEGMASGCVPIVTNVGGLPEVVEDGASGYVVPPQVDALADAMCRITDLAPAARRAMRVAALARTRRDFDAGRSMAVIVQVVAGGGSTQPIGYTPSNTGRP